MEFCVISPITGLGKYSTLSKRHLVLAHLLHNKEYMEFYSNRRRAGDTLILDNGAYENTRPLRPESYFNWIKSLDPQIVVLPDILMSPWRLTTSASLRFLDTYAELLEAGSYRTEFMYVPQCETARDNKDGFTSLQEWMTSLATVVNDGRVGRYVKWVGLGRYLHTEFVNLPNKPYRRARLCKEVKDHTGFRHLKVHALGMAAGDVDELKALKEAGCDSIDSSAPVWRGWLGYQLGDNSWNQHGKPCDFFDKETPNHKLILYNLEVVGVDTKAIR